MYIKHAVLYLFLQSIGFLFVSMVSKQIYSFRGGECGTSAACVRPVRCIWGKGNSDNSDFFLSFCGFHSFICDKPSTFADNVSHHTVVGMRIVFKISNSKYHRSYIVPHKPVFIWRYHGLCISIMAL